tara:strand:- start:2101 stop:2748 length:648 start_codon:yes stop_codon:yes gene_type:complete
MTDSPFIIYQNFQQKDEAKAFAQMLIEHGIEAEIKLSPAPYNTLHSGNDDNEYTVQIKKADKEKVDQLVDAAAKSAIDQFSKDHYLFEFSDEELLEVVEKKDEWSKEDYFLAQEILKQRGHTITAEILEELQKKRLKTLRQPDKGETWGLVLGVILAIGGGILGILIGWFYWTHKKTDPAGTKVYAYDKATRKKGFIIFCMGIISLTGWWIKIVN